MNINQMLQNFLEEKNKDNKITKKLVVNLDPRNARTVQVEQESTVSPLEKSQIIDMGSYIVPEDIEHDLQDLNNQVTGYLNR